MSMVHSPFAATFVDGTRFAHERDGEIVMRTHALGPLIVPSGRILVADPFTTDFDPLQVPLARQAPVGVFPVELAIACFDNSDERVACARVRFADAAAVHWEAASFAGEAPAPDGEPAGYGVDAGMGCFADLTSCTPQHDAPAEAWLTAVERGIMASRTPRRSHSARPPGRPGVPSPPLPAVLVGTGEARRHNMLAQLRMARADQTYDRKLLRA